MMSMSKNRALNEALSLTLFNSGVKLAQGLVFIWFWFCSLCLWCLNLETRPSRIGKIQNGRAYIDKSGEVLLRHFPEIHLERWISAGHHHRVMRNDIEIIELWCTANRP